MIITFHEKSSIIKFSKIPVIKKLDSTRNTLAIFLDVLLRFMEILPNDSVNTNKKSAIWAVTPPVRNTIRVFSNTPIPITTSEAKNSVSISGLACISVSIFRTHGRTLHSAH